MSRPPEFIAPDAPKGAGEDPPVVRVLLVDDHPFVLDGISGLLASQPDFKIVGEAATLAEGRELLATQKPALVIVDLRLPDGDGTVLLEEIRRRRWSTYGVVLSAFCSDDDLIAAARMEARAFLLKTDRGPAVLSQLRRVMRGENVLRENFPPALRPRLAQRDLTPKELEILRLIGMGLTNKEISQRIAATQNTVKIHLRRIFQKLDLTTRAEAAAVAVRRGLLG